MKRRYRRLSPAQSAELWDRWKAGEGLKSIGRGFGTTSSVIFNHIRGSGGIRPPPRRRSRLALTLAEREEISRGLVAGRSLRAIATALGRSASTLSREIARNGGAGRYRAAAADGRAWRRSLRPKPCKLANSDALRQLVMAKLQLEWSPQQIAGWLRRSHAHDEALQVSHETIYRSLYVQARGALKKELMEHLRTRRATRRSRHATMKGTRVGHIADAVSISERPASAEDRPGRSTAAGRAFAHPPAATHRRQEVFDPASGKLENLPAYRRADLGAGAALDGPALVVEPQTTTLVPAGWRAQVTAAGHLMLTRAG